jgi:tetratricopeptide (TPR) repeat protein
MRALEKDPAKRYQSAGEWLDAIKAYESGVSTIAGTEVITPSLEPPATTPTEMLTEALSQKLTAPQTREKDSAAASYATNVISSSATSNNPSTPSHIAPQSTPQASYETQRTLSRKQNPVILLIAGAVLLAIIAGIIAFLMLRPKPAAPDVSSTQTTVSPAASSTPAVTSVATEDARLLAAREAEKAERYVDAIRSYEEYLAAKPTAGDVASVSKQLATIKTLNGHLQMAKVWMDQGDFVEAKKDYAAALKAKPSSAAAKAGLAAAESRLSK